MPFALFPVLLAAWATPPRWLALRTGAVHCVPAGTCLRTPVGGVSITQDNSGYKLKPLSHVFSLK